MVEGESITPKIDLQRKLEVAFLYHKTRATKSLDARSHGWKWYMQFVRYRSLWLADRIPSSILYILGLAIDVIPQQYTS